MDISELEGKLKDLKVLVDDALSQLDGLDYLDNLLPVDINELEGKLADLKALADDVLLQLSNLD